MTALIRTLAAAGDDDVTPVTPSARADSGPRPRGDSRGERGIARARNADATRAIDDDGDGRREGGGDCAAPDRDGFEERSSSR